MGKERLVVDGGVEVRLEDEFTDAVLVEGKGALLALVTCVRCGATVTVIGANDESAKRHVEWHAK